MFKLDVAWWELIVRAVVVYVFLLLVLRATGKRQTGQLAPFDLVLLLVLSNAVQNSMNGGDNSLIGGLISAAALIGFNWLVALTIFRSKRLEGLVEGRPQILIHNGILFQDVMERNRMTHHELMSALRQHGYTSPGQVHCAIIETNGAISVTETARVAQPAGGVPPGTDEARP